jgi:hypothetical protein
LIGHLAGFTPSKTSLKYYRKIMAKITLSGIFPSLNDSDTPDIHPQNTTRKGDTTYVTVTPEILTDAEIYNFSLFCTAIGIEDIGVLHNYGSATYISDVFKGHCPCFLGKALDDDGSEYLGLKIGSDAGDYKAPILRVITELKQEKIGKRTVDKLVYILNETCVVELSESFDNEGKPTGKYYAGVVDDNNDLFTFPIMLDKKLLEGQDPSVVIRSWREGIIISLVKKFGAGGGKLWGTINKMFLPRFTDKTFPTSGVFMLLSKGNIKTTPAGSHPSITNDIIQPEWEILAVSHPDMVVIHKNIDKEFVDVPLGEVTILQGSSANNNNECYTWLVNNYHTYGGGVVMLHVVRPVAVLKNTPVNTITALPQKIERKLTMYPEMLDIYHQNTSITTTAKLAIAPGKSVSVEEATESLNAYINPIVDTDVMAEYEAVSEKEDIPF